MAKKFSFATYDRKHLKNLLRRAEDIGRLFSDAAREGVRIGEATGYTDPNGEFAFDKFPAVKQRVEELFKGLHDSLVLTVTEGNREEWLLSAAKNDALVDSKYSRAQKRLGDQTEAWHEPHLEALEQFNKRKERGMNLSDRVWRLADQFKGELELALELGLGDGKSAAALSREVRDYLNEPHKLFRRVRNEKGQLRLSKAAAAYHPGQGVYRSSYKNALRLTATENNMAYRTADHERWNDLDFVIGIEIQLSNNHPVEDICDEMCGVYPKTFKFVGWHPFCRCIAVPKLADEDEFIARQQALIDGENPAQGGYAGEITEMPQCFTDWVQENAERIETAKSQPYFIQDNRAAVDKIIYAKETFDRYIGERLVNKVQGFPISKEYIAAKSHNEVQERLRRDLNTATSETVAVEVEERLISLQAARAYATELSALANQYKLLQAPLGKVKLGYIPEVPFEYGVTHFNHNTKRPKTVSLIEAKDSRSQGYAVGSSRCDRHKTGIATATHEFAHLLYSVRTSDVAIKPFEDELRLLHSQYQSEIKKAIESNDFDNMAKWYLGNYADNSIDEFMAEAFQEYRNCKKPTRYALAVGELIDKFFKR